MTPIIALASRILANAIFKSRLSASALFTSEVSNGSLKIVPPLTQISFF